jgi:hypothetical protein
MFELKLLVKAGLKVCVNGVLLTNAYVGHFPSSCFLVKSTHYRSWLPLHYHVKE